MVIWPARCLLGASRNASVTATSSTRVMTLARQIAFTAGPRRSPRLRQRRAKAPVGEIDDVDAAQRVEIGAHDVRQGLAESTRLPWVEIGADRLAGELVQRR